MNEFERGFEMLGWGALLTAILTPRKPLTFVIMILFSLALVYGYPVYKHWKTESEAAAIIKDAKANGVSCFVDDKACMARQAAFEKEADKRRAERYKQEMHDYNVKRGFEKP